MRNVTPVLPMAAVGEGEHAACRVDGVDLIVCQVEGRYYAIEGRCPHARQSLAAGRLKGHVITCPLHGARFDVRDGRCLAPPAKVPLATFPVWVESGRLCVGVGTP
jgi:3-phenylpropionate/trans-cinnamate dioxygenase ferredoxin subunit